MPRPSRACLLPTAAACVLLGAAVALVPAGGVRANTHATPPPAPVQQALAPVVLAGQGSLRYFGLPIYGARLWVAPRFDKDDYASHPLALELTYERAFSGKAIAQRSIEEMHRQSPLPRAQAEPWQQALAALLPDVQAGDRLTGMYQPGRGLRLWHGDAEIGTLNDAELARRFFGIWLSPRTSEPALRRALLANVERTPR